MPSLSLLFQKISSKSTLEIKPIFFNMDANQINTAFTNVNSYWNLEKMETEEAILHDQFPMGSVWPSYPLQIQPSSSSSVVPTSSGFLNDMLGIQLEEDEEPEEELGAMKEMMYKIAAMQPVDIDPATIRKPKRRNVRISDDPQSIAARHRRERISEKIRILQRLVPGGTKLDTASMLDEAIRYVKFLKRQIRLLQSTQQCVGTTTSCSLAPGGDWPFAPPNILHSSTASSSSMDTAVRMGFNAAENHGSGGFNHEVISE